MTGSRDIAHSSEKKHPKKSFLAELMGGFISGIVDVIFLQPLDNAGKRLMKHRGKVQDFDHLKKVILQDGAKGDLRAKLKSGWAGSSGTMFYKMFQRTYRFGVQPIVSRWVDKNFGDEIGKKFGEKNRKTMCDLFSGLIIGLGEVGLLPLDKYKVILQTREKNITQHLNRNKDKMKVVFKDFVSILKNHPYAGWKQTAIRNGMGSPVLFALKTMILNRIFKVEQHNATWSQNFIASSFAGIGSVLSVAPLDTVKTRLQILENIPKTPYMPGIPMQQYEGLRMRDIIREEGFLALWKGGFVKSVTKGFGVGFTMFVSSELAKGIQSSTKSLQTNTMFLRAKNAQWKHITEEERPRSNFRLNSF